MRKSKPKHKAFMLSKPMWDGCEETKITSKQMCYIWDLVTRKGIPENFFDNTLADKYAVPYAGWLNIESAKRFIADLTQYQYWTRFDTSWIGERPQGGDDGQLL